MHTFCSVTQLAEQQLEVCLKLSHAGLTVKQGCSKHIKPIFGGPVLSRKLRQEPKKSASHVTTKATHPDLPLRLYLDITC